jgi:hypothetical protein
MPEVETLIRDPEVGPNLKILMLARDPRGVLMSRSGLYEPVSAVITRVKFLFVDFTRFARWYIFKQKIQIWVNFGGSCDGRC